VRNNYFDGLLKRRNINWVIELNIGETKLKDKRKAIDAKSADLAKKKAVLGEKGAKLATEKSTLTAQQKAAETAYEKAKGESNKIKVQELRTPLVEVLS